MRTGRDFKSSQLFELVVNVYLKWFGSPKATGNLSGHWKKCPVGLGLFPVGLGLFQVGLGLFPVAL